MILCEDCKFWFAENAWDNWGACNNPNFNVYISIGREGDGKRMSCLRSFGCVAGESKINKNKELLQKILNQKKSYEYNLQINLKNLQKEIFDLEIELKDGWPGNSKINFNNFEEKIEFLEKKLKPNILQ